MADQVELVEISDGVIDALAARPDAVAALPFLFAAFVAARKAADRACQRCKGNAARQALAAQYPRVKAAIVAMPAAGRDALKGLLNARKLRVVSGVTHAGVPVRHTL